MPPPTDFGCSIGVTPRRAYSPTSSSRCCQISCSRAASSSSRKSTVARSSTTSRSIDVRALRSAPHAGSSCIRSSPTGAPFASRRVNTLTLTLMVLGCLPALPPLHSTSSHGSLGSLARGSDGGIANAASIISATACWCVSGTKCSTKCFWSTRSRRKPVASAAAAFQPETHPCGSTAHTKLGETSRIARKSLIVNSRSERALRNSSSSSSTRPFGCGPTAGAAAAGEAAALGAGEAAWPGGARMGDGSRPLVPTLAGLFAFCAVSCSLSCCSSALRLLTSFSSCRLSACSFCLRAVN
mmetsp:Transcript_28305/g.64105  ORF Transcript_28305/g.64105 Transcript_28305/m.64105 type:complete len:298 (-) Transcript_28305:142-1035(-)